AAGMWTESYPAMEYRHGPIAVTGPGSVVWLLGPAPDGLAAEVAGAGGVALQSSGDPMAELVLVQRLGPPRGPARRAGPRRPRPARPHTLNRSATLAPRWGVPPWLYAPCSGADDPRGQPQPGPGRPMTAVGLAEIVGPASAAGRGVGAFNIIGIEYAE